MNAKLALLWVAGVALPACIIEGTPPPATTGGATLTFNWSFANATCAQTPTVASVQVTMPGQQFASNGLYPCDSAGYDGISLTDFADGTYDFTLQGLAADNVTVLFSASGTVTIQGADLVANVNLQPVAGTMAYLSWTFPDLGGVAQSTCAAAGVATVDVNIDQQGSVSVPCPTGQTAPGYPTPTLDAGTHAVSLVALDSKGLQRYATSGTFLTSLGQTTSQGLSFQWTVGGAQMAFALENADAGVDCADAGLSALTLQVFDSHGVPQFPGYGQAVTCSGGEVGVTLATGSYSAVLSGANDAGTVYSSGAQTPVALTVQAGVFPAAACAPAADTDCVSAVLQAH